MKTKIVYLNTKNYVHYSYLQYRYPEHTEVSMTSLKRLSLSTAIVALSQHSHLQYLHIPSSSVNIPCTSEHETPSLSSITLMVVLVSMLTMSLTKSLMEQVTTARWPLLKTSSIDSLPFLKCECHL